MTIKEQIQAKLYEVEQLLLGASCDGVQLDESDDVFGEIKSTLDRLANEVDYYVD